MLLNLFPYREARRRRRRQAFSVLLAAAAGLGLVAALLGYAALQRRTAAQERRNELLSAEIAALDAPLLAAARLRAELTVLQGRVQELRSLQWERRRPAQLLEALARHTPEGVQLTTLRQQADRFTLGGVAQGSAEVQALVRKLSQDTALLQRVALVEIKAAAPAGRDARRLFDFTLEFQLQPLPATATAAATASAPAPSQAASSAVPGMAPPAQPGPTVGQPAAIRSGA
ncbi:PilN domain-containing protein [uncultured Azohydromonas sp.]|jgi:Tfp pilus assembly protein PilN|uniref:PilN domain-containing protein n=1 Tax=uncultured Azohydromonas sp. TaxID=487342 RepID=UPI002626D398|nr:PilN domain-containing protein [uncultured Azohydromonas sp.]